jgi:hypothetical protein
LLHAQGAAKLNLRDDGPQETDDLPFGSIADAVGYIDEYWFLFTKWQMA